MTEINIEKICEGLKKVEAKDWTKKEIVSGPSYSTEIDGMIFIFSNSVDSATSESPYSLNILNSQMSYEETIKGNKIDKTYKEIDVKVNKYLKEKSEKRIEQGRSKLEKMFE